jgi:hypothetical protein
VAVTVKLSAPAPLGVPLIARLSVPPAGTLSPGIVPWTLPTLNESGPVPPPAQIIVS